MRFTLKLKHILSERDQAEVQCSRSCDVITNQIVLQVLSLFKWLTACAHFTKKWNETLGSLANHSEDNKAQSTFHLHKAGDNEDTITHVEELNYLKEKQINAPSLIVSW